MVNSVCWQDLARVDWSVVWEALDLFRVDTELVAPCGRSANTGSYVGNVPFTN